MLATQTDPGKARGGRPTRAAAAERDERLLAIATDMFMADGFDATSMDRLAEAASIGKATLYARYADKTALFDAVLRRRILQVYGPIEAEFRDSLREADLESALRRIGLVLLTKSLAPESIALARILSSQGPRFPELIRLAIEEGSGRQLRLVEMVLSHFSATTKFVVTDLSLAADLFLSIVIGRTGRLAIYGVSLDATTMKTRTEEAVRLFVRGLVRQES